MRIVTLIKDDEIIVIPTNKINYVSWDKGELTLYIDVGRPFCFYFSFDSEEEGRQRFEEILSDLRNSH